MSYGGWAQGGGAPSRMMPVGAANRAVCGRIRGSGLGRRRPVRAAHPRRSAGQRRSFGEPRAARRRLGPVSLVVKQRLRPTSRCRRNQDVRCRREPAEQDADPDDANVRNTRIRRGLDTSVDVRVPAATLDDVEPDRSDDGSRSLAHQLRKAFLIPTVSARIGRWTRWRFSFRPSPRTGGALFPRRRRRAAPIVERPEDASVPPETRREPSGWPARTGLSRA